MFSVKLGLRTVMVGCAAGSIALGALVSIGPGAGAAPATVTLHYFQKQTALTFYNSANAVIQGYPPLGGHVREDDVDYAGSHSHHAKDWTVSDHLYCTVVSSPATANCFTEFAVGGSLLYVDYFTFNLASPASSVTLPLSGGTGQFAGYKGSLKLTDVGRSNNSDVVISLHKR